MPFLRGIWNLIFPSFISMIAPMVRRKGRPKIIGHKGLMSTHSSILVDYVGPPSVKVCRTTTNFPQLDDLRFIELREVEVEDGLPHAIMHLINEKSLVSPTLLIQLGVV